MNIHQAKSGVKKFSLYRWRGGGGVWEVAQNDVKHILVLEFLRPDNFLGVLGGDP